MSKRKKKAPDADRLFGELRGMLQQGVISHGQQVQVWSICQRMNKHHPKVYESVWVPYLESYASVWRPHDLIVRSLEELEQAVKLAPFSRFKLVTSSHTSHNVTHKLLRSALLAHIHAIDVDAPETLQLLLKSPHVNALTELRIRAQATHTLAQLFRALARSTSRETLKIIELEGGAVIPCNQRSTLDDVESFPSLHTLRIADIKLQTRDVRVLAAAPMMRTISTIALDRIDLSESELPQFIEHNTFAGVTSLTLGRVQHTANTPQLCELLESPMLVDLEHLALPINFTRYKPIAASKSISSQPLHKLHSLDLYGNQLGITALKCLASSLNLDTLRALSLEECEITQAMINLITGHLFFSRLDELRISSFYVDRYRAEITHSKTLSAQVIDQLLNS